MQFVVLSSSRGTVFQSVIEAMQSGNLTARCLGLVTDREDRECIAKAEAVGIPCVMVSKISGESPEEYDTRLDTAIRSLGQVDLICLMGWMFVLSSPFVSKWKDQIINVHPALLPKYGGKGMYGHHVHEAVLASGDQESGITIHRVDEGVDTGEIILQKKCEVRDTDTVETLQQRVQELEKEWYPKVLQDLTPNT